MNITLRQLEVFEAVARRLNFTRAAEELYLTQPAVSMKIKQLEKQVEEPLFEQMGKKITLTEAGQEVHRYSLAIRQQLEELQMVLEQMKGLEKGRLTLSVASTANYFIPTLLGVFTERHSGITVDIDVTNRENLLRALDANTTDFAIMGQPPPGLPVESHRFLENPLVVIAPPNHRLAGARKIALMALGKETLIDREQGSGTRLARERFFSQQGVGDLQASMEMSSNEAIKQAVQAGLGLGVLSIHTLEAELLLNRLVVLDVEKFPIMRHWCIVHRHGKRFSAVAEAFKRFVLTESRKLIRVPSARGAESSA